MQITQGNTAPPAALTIARHVAAMGIAALANPMIYFDTYPVEVWAMTLLGAIGIASALFALLALIQPHRIPVMFPMTPIKSAWFILALMIFANWQDYRELRAERAPSKPIAMEAPATPKANTFTYEEAIGQKP